MVILARPGAIVLALLLLGLSSGCQSDDKGRRDDAPSPAAAVPEPAPQAQPKSPPAPNKPSPVDELKATASIPQGLKCLKAAYPEHICSVSANAIHWCDGTKMAYDDGKAHKTHAQFLEGADLEDQMKQRYLIGTQYPEPPQDFDPGRARHEPFFKKMYGQDAKAVSRTLVPVFWMPKTVNRRILVTGVNGIDKKLKAVSDEIEALPEPIRKMAQKTSGTFVWRTIKGTDRLSSHSFAIAVDVGVEFSDYWKWARKPAGAPLPYKNRFPLEVVEIFERHGFVWGGKWYHYDTMHFEYRPELLADGCVLTSPP